MMAREQCSPFRKMSVTRHVIALAITNHRAGFPSHLRYPDRMASTIDRYLTSPLPTRTPLLPLYDARSTHKQTHRATTPSNPTCGTRNPFPPIPGAARFYLAS